MKHFLLILLVVNGFCFESEIHYGGNIIKLPKCNINMVVDSSLVYIGDLTTDYYDDDNSKILIGKVVYRLNGVGIRDENKIYFDEKSHYIKDEDLLIAYKEFKNNFIKLRTQTINTTYNYQKTLKQYFNIIKQYA